MLAWSTDHGIPKRIQGVIADRDNHPVIGATVEIVDLSGNDVASAVTDESGRFEIITTAKQGEYELLVTNSRQLNDRQITLGRTDIDIKLTISGAPDSALPRQTTVSVQQFEIPEKVRTRVTSAQEQFNKGNLQGAFKELAEVLRLDPSCSEAWAMRAYLKLAAEDSSGAADDALHAIELDSNNGGAYLALGTAYNSQREFAKAEQALRRALELRPELWQAQLEMAKAWYGEKRFVLALRQLELMGRDFPDTHLVRANVLMSLGRQQDGAAEFTRFLEEAPSDPRNPQIESILAHLHAGNTGQNSDQHK